MTPEVQRVPVLGGEVWAEPGGCTWCRFRAEEKDLQGLQAAPCWAQEQRIYPANITRQSPLTSLLPFGSMGSQKEKYTQARRQCG